MVLLAVAARQQPSFPAPIDPSMYVCLQIFAAAKRI